jgi:uncharacterized protein
MAQSVLVDAGFRVALLSRRDGHHRWAASTAPRFAPPWISCESALSEAFHLLGAKGSPALLELLGRGAVVVGFELAGEIDVIRALMRKYADLPMSLADACLVRMTEILRDPVLLTTDRDFRVYRRNNRQVVPSRMP